MLLTVGCSAAERRVEIEPLPFRGGVAADEPRAALVAREVLEAGGAAADAAVALYFALAVTKPSAAGLGAGGVCLAYDPLRKKVQAIDFAPPPAPAGAGEAVAPPGAVAGMAALHAGFGRLRWGQLVAPAEMLARFGAPVSHSLANDLAEAAPMLALDPAARTIFLRPDGGPAREGDLLRQPDLADMLGAVRTEEPGRLRSGPWVSRFVQAVGAAGGDLTLEEAQSAAPQAQEPITLRSGSTRVHFAPSFATMGPYQALLWRLLTEDDRLLDAAKEERPQLVADAAARARAAASVGGDRAPAAGADAAPPDGSGTGFVVADARGGAVACGLTLGRPFGLGRIAPGTGTFPAVRRPAGAEATALSPVLAMNPNTQILILAAAGSGLGAPTALTELAVRTVAGREALAAALSGPRVEHLASSGAILAEPGAADHLAAQGNRVQSADALGRLNALFCADGLPDNPESCEQRTDRRGFGLDLRLGK